MHRSLLFIVVALLASCKGTSSSVKHETTAPRLTIDQANRLAHLPVKCISQEYPNKLSQTLVGPDELQSPRQLHPSFYGCFDWHSSVHGHWVLVKLLNDFPELKNKAEVQARLLESLSKENMAKETEYFLKKHERSYERTYGWAWYLKLVDEIKGSKIEEVKQLEANLTSPTARSKSFRSSCGRNL